MRVPGLNSNAELLIHPLSNGRAVLSCAQGGFAKVTSGRQLSWQHRVQSNSLS